MPEAMLALPAPYGWEADNGACITLTSDAKLNDEAVVKVLRQYSCWPPVIPRILSCLAHGGRYDCVLQATWFKHQQHEVTRDLAELGVTLHFRGWLREVRGY